MPPFPSQRAPWRFTAILFGGMIAIGAFVDAPPAASQQFDAPSRPPTAAILAEQTELAFAETPLEITIQVLADLHDVPIVIDKPALQAAKIDPELEVNRVASGITLESGLNIILDEHGLDWFIRDGKAIVVTTAAAAAAKELRTKKYPLGGLKQHGIASRDVLRVLDETFGLRMGKEQQSPGIASLDDDAVTLRHNRRGQTEVAIFLSELDAVASGQPLPASAAEKRIRSELSKPAKMRWDQLPLEYLAYVIRNRHGFTALIDRRALKAKSIDVETTVQSTADEIKLESALSLALLEKGLVWMIEDEVLVITTPEAANRKLLSRPYSLSALKKAGIEPDDVSKALDLITGSRSDAATNGASRSLVTGDVLVVRHRYHAQARVARLLADLLAAAQGRPVERSPARDEKIRAELSKQTEVAFFEISFSTAFDVLGDLHDFDWKLDRRAIPKTFEKGEPEITKNQTGRLSTIIDEILTPMDATYVIEHEALLVTSIKAAEERPEIRVYDIREIARTAAGKERVRAAVKEIAREPLRSKTAPAPASAEIGDSFLIVSASAPRQRALEAALAALRSRPDDSPRD